jgi:hypothetical protein
MKLLALLAALLVGSASAAPVAEWTFSEAAGSTLNQTANSGTGVNGPGTPWNVAITGTPTTGSGELRIANDGKGGSGTRSAYADFGPDFDSLESGRYSLFARFSDWALPASGSQRFTLGFIEGNDFSTAAFSLAAAAGGFLLTGDVDPWGDGETLAQSFSLPSWQALTVRLDLDLDLLSYRLGIDLGAGFSWLGSAAIDSLTQGVNSLRLGLEGDFTHNPLLLDRIWLEPTAAAAVPLPGTAALLLLGLGLLSLRRKDRV